MSEKNLLGKQFLSEKILQEKILLGKYFVGKYLSEKKKLVGKTVFVRKNLLKNFIEKKNYWKIFLSESGGCDLICIFVYQMGRLCGEPMKYQT